MELTPELEFKKIPVVKVMLLSIATLGVYAAYWFYSRRKLINRFATDQGSELQLLMSGPVLWCCLFSVAAIPLRHFLMKGDSSLTTSLAVIFALPSKIVGLLFPLMALKVRKILSPRFDPPLSAAAALFFNIYYLQYRINRSAEALNQGLDAPEWPRPAGSAEAPVHPLDRLIRGLTLASLSLSILGLVLVAPMAFVVGIMATDSGIRPSTLAWAYGITLAPVLCIVALQLLLIWLEAHRRYYRSVGSLFVALFVAGVLALGPSRIATTLYRFFGSRKNESYPASAQGSSPSRPPAQAQAQGSPLTAMHGPKIPCQDLKAPRASSPFFLQQHLDDLKRCLPSMDEGFKQQLALRSVQSEILGALSHENAAVRRSLALNPMLPYALRKQLQKDPDPLVRASIQSTVR